MASEDNTRYFALREDDDETSVFTGNTPRQAGLKAARRLDSAPSEEAASNTEIRLRERGTDKVHIYEGWAWREETDDDAPDFLGDTVSQANVSKQGIVHLDDE